MTIKEWRKIPGFDTRYEVSADGELRSWTARGGAAHGGNKWAKAPRVVKGGIGNHGYRQFGILTDEGRFISIYMHQLVLAAFVGPAPEGQVTRHLNGDSSDNRLDNLAYGTQAENIADTELHGRRPRGETSGKSKITNAIALAIIERYSSGESQMSIAKSYGMGQSAISSVIRGETWSHVTGIR